jgi:predicted HicB family RNase H-like nuclease
MKTTDRNSLHYRGYVGSIEFSEEDAVFHGKVVGIKSLVSFEGDSVNTITEDFHDAVDEYLEYCEEKGIEPERPFKGSFNVRVGSELHRQAALEASERGVSLNALVEDALRQVVGQR